MKITDIQGLYIAKSTKKDFSILILADDTNEAKKIAKSYSNDTNIDEFDDIHEFNNINENIDCDYIITRKRI